jgi:hypothetical protein
MLLEWFYFKQFLTVYCKLPVCKQFFFMNFNLRLNQLHFRVWNAPFKNLSIR